MEKEKKKAICQFCFTCTGVLVIFIALVSVGIYLRPEDNDLEQLVGGFQAALKNDDKNALKGMFPLDQQTEQLLDKLTQLQEHINVDLVNVTYGGKHCGIQKYAPCNHTYIGNVLLSWNGGIQSSVTIVAKGQTGCLKLISLTPNNPSETCHGSFIACFLDMVYTLPTNPGWKELGKQKVRKQMKLISIGLKRRYPKFLKNLMKPETEIDGYLKKHYREILEINVDKIEKGSTMNDLTAYLSIHQGKEEVVAKISMILNKESPTGFTVHKGTICIDTVC